MDNESGLTKIIFVVLLMLVQTCCIYVFAEAGEMLYSVSVLASFIGAFSYYVYLLKGTRFFAG